MRAVETGELPAVVAGVLGGALVAELATLTAAGHPVTWPMTPFVDTARSGVHVSTGVAYGAKAERARRDPRVALLAGGGDRPLVAMRALATTRDADLQANTDRYLRESVTKTGDRALRQAPKRLQAQAWYWVRSYIELTPVEVRWWPAGRADGEPERWVPGVEVTAPPSDPAPEGRRAAPWQRPAGPWTARAAVAARLGAPALTVVGPDGFPVVVPTSSSRLVADGFALAFPGGVVGDVADGPACLTFDALYGGERFEGQENVAFTGRVDGDRFVVERALPDFSLPPRGWAKYRNYLGAHRRLRQRVAEECARRGQAVPIVNPRRLEEP